MYVCIYVCMYACMYVCMYVCTYIGFGSLVFLVKFALGNKRIAVNTDFCPVQSIFQFITIKGSAI